ncbi:MAG: copper resistance protein B [Alphaproteobacteria bacterium]|nr:copper resistance protein B [Alphaproteobacteria bacterium]
MRTRVLSLRAALFAAGVLILPAPSGAAELDDTIFKSFEVEQLEYRIGDGTDVVAWDVNAWIGNDDHRLAFKSEGENPVNEELEAAEFQLLYRRPISDFFDANVGVRHDIRPDPDRTYGVIGVEGLAVQFVEMDANLFVSEIGAVSVRFEAEKDFLLTQRLILQPLLEVNVAFTKDTAIGSGAGVNDLELGLRLRYEFWRKLAPYVGVHWERKFGRTADFAREEGEDTENVYFVSGVKFWF